MQKLAGEFPPSEFKKKSGTCTECRRIELRKSKLKRHGT